MRPILVAALALGCHAEPDPRHRRRPASPTAPTGTATDSGTPVDTGSATSDVVDCAEIPDPPFTPVQLDAPRAYNDVVLDEGGALIGHDDTTGAFLAATDPSTASVLAPFADTVYKLGRLPDGDLVATTATSGLVRIAPSGSISTVVPGLRAYGLAVHPSGAVFAATNYTAGTDGIVRIDPATGDWELVEPLPATPRDIAFGPGFGTLYIGTTDGGAVLALRLDAQGEPTGPAAHLLDVPAAWHDTVEVDACGNLYVGSVFSTSIFRVRAADGSVQEVLDWPPGFNGPYGHGLQWGEGPWSDRSIFVAHPYVGSRVTEWAIGVPGARWPGTALGAAEL